MPDLVEAVKRGMHAGRRVADEPSRPSRSTKASSTPHLHVPAQPDGAWTRGDGARPADGRRGADRRLRQDHAGPADGRGRSADIPAIVLPPARCWSATTRARCSAPAPIAAACGPISAPAASTRRRSTPSPAAWRTTKPAPACRDGHRQHRRPASTETLGMCLPGAGSAPATHADRIRLAEASGAAAVRWRNPAASRRTS
jgi:hypothetical protein